jgi:hypothetical protein
MQQLGPTAILERELRIRQGKAVQPPRHGPKS